MPHHILQPLRTAIAIVTWLAASSVHAADTLSPTDQASLTFHLQTIAADAGWPQASVNAANDIFAKAEYTAAAWTGYFDGYLAANPFNDQLYNYLNYPTFWWLGDDVNVKLQQGLHQPLMNRGLAPAWNAAAKDGAAFADDSIMRQTLWNSQRMLTQMGSRGTLSQHASQTREAIYQDLKGLFSAHGDLLSMQNTIDIAAQPHVATARTQLAMALLANADQNTGRPDTVQLTHARHSDVEATLGLAGEHAQLWQDHNVLLMDNNGTSAAQRQRINSVLSQVPASLHNLASITVYDFIGQPPGWLDRPYDGVNIFGINVGGRSENPFPSDVPAHRDDLFSAALGHELMHVIDAYTVQQNAALAARREALLLAAGSDAQNYLRSMFDDELFQSSPQEFIASIGNQWFANSLLTVELGLERFDAGRLDPLNQALFMLEIFSQGADHTLFYTSDITGELHSESVPLWRNESGFITGFLFEDSQYDFVLDATGDVQTYTVTLIPEPGTLALLVIAALSLQRRHDPLRLRITAAAICLLLAPGGWATSMAEQQDELPPQRARYFSEPVELVMSEEHGCIDLDRQIVIPSAAVDPKADPEVLAANGVDLVYRYNRERSNAKHTRHLATVGAALAYYEGEDLTPAEVRARFQNRIDLGFHEINEPPQHRLFRTRQGSLGRLHTTALLGQKVRVKVWRLLPEGRDEENLEPVFPLPFSEIRFKHEGYTPHTHKITITSAGRCGWELSERFRGGKEIRPDGYLLTVRQVERLLQALEASQWLTAEPPQRTMRTHEPIYSWNSSTTTGKCGGSCSKPRRTRIRRGGRSSHSSTALPIRRNCSTK